MKKLILICSIIAVTLSVFLFIHFNKEGSYGESIDFLKNLDSYRCNVEIQIKNDKQNIKFKGKQFYNKDLGYRFEINKDRILLYKKNKIFVKDLVNGVKYNTDREFDKLYKLTFIGEYINLLYTNEEIKVDIRTVNDINYEVISLIIPGNNRNYEKADLFVNKKDNIPTKLVIYDKKNRIRVTVNYKNFVPNSDDGSSIFEPSKF
ncbi:hypothetical protein FDF74_05720 [Clostridium niameyense]|uniref:Membrane associated protein n=1 Tax=Clostridium niameyense TaxID=1622073 RepID=A0A6M0R8Y5_9CLOT|nr:germination lipoprotein GerS-related protein [Clostridium niameyense]NEZ46713.1 hypothetical protein [Clostridium niameyense]